MTTSQTPPMKISDEANEEQLNLAREQGKVYLKALQHMLNEVADSGAEQAIGDYIVAYAIEDAEGMYHKNGKKLEWKLSPERNIHIEVSVRDAADNRFIPNLDIEVTLRASNGKAVGTHKQAFVWHPWLYHYGRNWEVSNSGTYTLQVVIQSPDFPRHDEKNGQRYQEAVTVTFEDVQINLD